MLAERLRVGDMGSRSPPSVELGPHVMPGLTPARADRSCEESEWLWRRFKLPSSFAAEPVSSKTVLEGEAGLGGEPEREVAELREEKVNVLWGAAFSGVEKVEVREESLEASPGARLSLFPDFVRLSMLPIRENSFGLCCGAAVDGEKGVPLSV